MSYPNPNKVGSVVEYAEYLMVHLLQYKLSEIHLFPNTCESLRTACL